MLLLVLGLGAACTKPNPAYRINGASDDAAGEEAASEEIPPPGPTPDGAVARQDGPAGPGEDGPSFTPDATAPDAAADSVVVPDAPRDLAPLNPDLALIPDVAPPPPDLPRDVAADSGVSNMSIVAHWKLDDVGSGTVTDSTPNLSHGATRNGATQVAGGFPRTPNPGSLRLDGQDDYVEINNVKNIPGSSTEKSITAWFKATNPEGIPIRNLVALTNETADWGVQLGLDQGRVSAWFYGDLAPRIWQQSGKVDTNWHHAAYTFDGTTHRIYYDGRLEMSRAIAPPMIPVTITRTRLGTWKAPEEMFHGLIDDVRIYARKLDDAEVMVLYNGN